MPTLIACSHGVFSAILTDPSGRQRWQSRGEKTKTAALLKLNDLLRNPPPHRVRVLLGEFIRFFLEVTGNIPLRAINQRHIDEFKSWRMAGHPTGYVEYRATHLASSILHGDQMEDGGRNPISQRKALASR